jgi:leucyl aminopeptidase
MLHLTTVHLKREKIKTLLVPVCQDKPIHKSAPLVALIEQALKLKEFKGQKDQEVVLYNPQGLAAERVMLRGLGKAEALDAEALRQVVGKALKRCIQMDVSRLWVAVPEAKAVGLAMPALLKALLEAAYLGNHVFNRYRQEKEPKPLARIELVVDGPTQREFARLPAEVEMVCRETVLAREWVNTPSNEKPPAELARLSPPRPEKQASPRRSSTRPSCAAANSARCSPSPPAVRTDRPWWSSSTSPAARAPRSSWSARASPSTRAASTSKPAPRSPS